MTSSDSPACEVCGFRLWIPVASLRESRVGLYSDARFAGRLIVSANKHFDHFDQMDSHSSSVFVNDVQRASHALRGLPGVERVNVAILGNKVSHVHAHLIPRRASDVNYGLSPWENALPWEPLTTLDEHKLIVDIKQRFLKQRLECDSDDES